MKNKIQILMLMVLLILINIFINSNVLAAHISPCQGGGGVTNKYFATGSTSTHKVETYCDLCGGIINSSTGSHSWGSWY